MFAEPTINDFLDRLRWHSAKAQDRAARRVSELRANAAGSGNLNSSRLVIFTTEAVRKEFEAAVDVVLAELKRAIHTTKLDKAELRQHAVQHLMNVANAMKAIAQTPEVGRMGMAAHLAELSAAFDQHLQFAVRQFDTGLSNSPEPETPPLTSNSTTTAAMVGSTAEQPTTPMTVPSRDIFIVHGQDGPAKIEVTHFIERAGLNAIVLHEQANGGKTIIEKFEKHGGAAGYAVVLMTPDDVGGPVGGPMKPRARQNVIGEMFWFSGKLGRSRVAALRKGDVEIPSDLHGIVYIPMDDHGGWKPALLKELTEAGYTVDWGKALA